MEEFSPIVQEKIRYYVYLLLDPRDNKIFYVGKGCGNRVFQHVANALETKLESDKLDKIRDINTAGKIVKYYIVRHDLDEDDAFTVESVLIDLLTYPEFSSIAAMSNVVAGHHQFDKGIKTAEEIEILYNCPPLKEEEIKHNVLTININKTYKAQKDKNNVLNAKHPSIYEATRKSWVLDMKKLNQIEYVLSEYQGVIRAIFKPTKWYKDVDNKKRWMFEGEEITEVNTPEIFKLYANKTVPEKKKGMANPIRYYMKGL